ncbi:hypothetical protein [Mesobacillus jeotgali]|uniref:hypothetical protein n=1 Tax=Mesobacillus jeotgali TaxID=129985 RepID=UPI0009A7714F|nr:hypothetical protein [Mesobacillus jeotgali]
MTFKSLIVSLGTLILSTGLFYLIGHIFSIESLMFYYEFHFDGEGFFVSSGSMIPLVIGLLASFIAERQYVKKRSTKHE